MGSESLDAIFKELENYVKSSEFQKEIAKNADQYGAVGEGLTVAQEAGKKFADVLKQTIETSPLSAGVVEAISNIGVEPPKHIKENTYQVTVYFKDDLSRMSLSPSRYNPINDLAELYNDGVSHRMKRVYGKWYSKTGYRAWDGWGNQRVGSRTVIPGTHFMEQAINEFMQNYAPKYGVVNIEINRGGGES